jgi:hypothetical protein
MLLNAPAILHPFCYRLSQDSWIWSSKPIVSFVKASNAKADQSMRQAA